jgi:hypothetical protein
VDLFPFLGIIVCVIGVLVLLISGLAAAGGIQELAIKDKERVQALLALVDRLIGAEQSIGDTKARLAAALNEIDANKAKAVELALAREKLAAIQKQLASADAAAVEAKMKELAQLKLTIASLDRETRELQPMIAKAGKDATDAEQSVTVQLIGGDSKIKPIYIECHKAGLTVYSYPHQKLYVRNINLTDIKNGEEFTALVGAVAESAKRGEGDVLNLLVRSDGVPAYDAAMTVVSKGDTPYASIPITAAGRIRFRDPATSQPVN